MDELLLLIQVQLDDELTPEQAQRLSELLRDNPEALELYAETCRLDQQLRTELEAETTTAQIEQLIDAQPEPAERRAQIILRAVVGFFARPTPFSMTVAALFIGLLVTAMAFLTAPFYRQFAENGVQEPHNRRPTLVARLTGVRDPVWAPANEGLHLGHRLAAGRRLELREGLAKIEYDKGATLVLEGPVIYTLGDARIPRVGERDDWGSLGDLERGKLTALMSSGSRGLAIETPWGAVLHVGTEYGLAIGSDGSTSVEVFDGVVELHRRVDSPVNSLIARLEQGQTAKLTPDGEVSDQGARADVAFVRAAGFLQDELPEARTIAHWRFEDVNKLGVGRVNDAARDSSGNGNHLEWFSRGGEYEHGPGAPASMLRGNVSNRSLKPARSPTGNCILFLQGSDGNEGGEHVPSVYRQIAVAEFTVEGFFRTSSTRRGDLVGYGDRFVVYVEDGRLHFEAGGGSAVLGSAGQFSNDDWHYFAATCRTEGDRNVISLRAKSERSGFVRSNSVVVGRLQTADRNLSVGGDIYKTGHLFDGLIDEVRISRGARGDDQLLVSPP